MHSSITPERAWALIDALSPEALCASLPSVIDQSRGFKLSYLGTEPIVSPIVLSLPITSRYLKRTTGHAHFLVEECQFFDSSLDYDSLFSDLTSTLNIELDSQLELV